MRGLVVFTLLHLLVSGVLSASKQKIKSVTTLIDAKWETTPLVLEVAEFLADENPDSLWSFVDAVCELETPLANLESDKEAYEAALLEASKLLPDSQLSVLRLALSLHVYSPKVEMYSQMAAGRGILAKGCPAAVDVDGRLTCDVTELQHLIRQDALEKIETFDLDHHFPGSHNISRTAVLYGELGTPEFTQLHTALKSLAAQGLVDYVLRHYVKERPARQARLSGYGVELQIKSTEYRVQDDTEVKRDKTADGSEEEEEEEEEIEGFNFGRLKMLYPDKIESLDKLRQHLLESTNEMAPLKVWQVQELSLQAAARIMTSPRDEALKVMTHIAQNFPLQARSLVRTVVNPELKAEVKANQDMFASTLNLQTSDTALFVNGMFFDLDVTDTISLLEVVRQELRVMEGLHKIGISDKQMSALMALDLSSGASSAQDYAVDIRDSAVMWVNDLEKDSQYRRWSQSLMELLRPTFPGMMRHVRRNLFNLVLIVNPAQLESRSLLKLAESFYIHSAPLRIGLVFAVNANDSVSGQDDAGVAMLNAFNYVTETDNAYQGLSFITDVYAAVKEERDILPEDVATQLRSKHPSADVDEILGMDSEYDTGRRLAKDFVERAGFRKFPTVLLNGVPLSEKQLTAEEFEEAVLTEIMSQTPTFQKAVYKGELTDSESALDFVMSRPNVMPRLNDRVLGTESSAYLDMAGTAAPDRDFGTISPRDKTATMVQTVLHYFGGRGHGPYMLTHWVVCDLQLPEGRRLLMAALEQMRSSGSIRVALIANPLDEEPQHLTKLVLTALEALPPQQATQYVTRILEDETLATSLAEGVGDPFDIVVAGVDLTPLKDALSFATILDSMKLHRNYCGTVLNLAPGARAVVTNGRILGPLDAGEAFSTDDFSLLERYSTNTYGDKISALLKKLSVDEEGTGDINDSNVLMQAVALLSSRPQTRSRFEIPFRGDVHSVVKLPARWSDRPAFDLAVIVDPVSRGAQKAGPILSVLHETLNCNVRVFLNCIEKHSDMPLKSFYRFVLEAAPQFTPDGRLAGPVARFNNMPPSVLLTQNMHVPENWLVESVRSPYDLDNIRLSDVDSTVHSEFELEHLLLEGHCFEATMGNPPRGLQITLGTEVDPVQVDTIVMANLGYFQLKANPGAWVLRLRQGRSADIFDMVGQDGKVLVSSLRSHVLKLKVAKKPDKMHMDLLSEDDPGSGIWDSITSTFGATKKAGEDEGEEKLNIFSLASGHLYERFLRIMMLSVLKHTKTPVKFWFLKNYLSPTLKDFLPHMAREYGFEYELVQYKWPRWLHQQTEKQRIIWGYKILFLDVLFPLDVKKIIFVDADAIVRADMRELRDFDLGGAPYGYTPFCDSRSEMDGFRFWKQGYWRNHLQGRRYHISALYVVDLRRFRRVAAGDRLRGQYQALSQDPNSLSNLDQDLPNNMIHQVSIKSLPQDWLWCETWCDNTSKARAKAIDLCNNPLTKEAKLTAAMRIVEEWRDYDAEIRALQNRINVEELTHEEAAERDHSAQHMEL